MVRRAALDHHGLSCPATFGSRFNCLRRRRQTWLSERRPLNTPQPTNPQLPQTSATAIALQQVVKSYGGQVVVDHVDLALPQGHTYALLGPSGCGKSTLLRLMLGLIQPDEGHVRLNGEVLTADNAELARRKIGYVIQDGGLFPHLTARENVTLMAQFLGWNRSDCNTRVEELAELTRFPADGLDRYPGQLSGGQRQRVGLMRALMLDPAILLLDEPLGALDPMVRNELQNDLRDIFRRLGKTVVLVTHDLHEAAFFSREVVLLRAGRIEQRGAIRELVEHPRNDFVTSFVQAQRSSLFETAS